MTKVSATDPDSAGVGRKISEWLSPPAFAVFRIVVAALFISHGAQKLFGVLGGVDGQGSAVTIGAWPIWWAGVIEVVAGALVLLGLFTRSAAVLCAAAMGYAYLVAHQPQALHPLQNGGEAALLFCVIFLVIGALGPGRFALDRLLERA